MMKATVIAFAAGALLLAGGGDEALKKERARLKGTWTVKMLETPKGPQDGFAGATLVIGEDSMELQKDGETKKAHFKLNPSAKPKEIDLTPENDANKIMRGIYEVKKDTLRICIGVGDNSDRPNAFTATQGGTHILLTLERAK